MRRLYHRRTQRALLYDDFAFQKGANLRDMSGISSAFKHTCTPHPTPYLMFLIQWVISVKKHHFVALLQKRMIVITPYQAYIRKCVQQHAQTIT